MSALTSEHIRAIISEPLAIDDQSTHQSIASATITRLVSQRIAGLWLTPADRSGTDGSEPKDFVRAELAHLADLGDVYKGEGGQWLPTPPRCIAIDDSVSLLLSSSPVSLLPLAIQRPLFTVGRARLLSIAETNGAVQLSVIRQRLTDWLNLPYGNVRKWATEFRDARSRTMQRVEGIDDAQIHFNGTWRNLSSKFFTDGVYLSRRRVLMPNRWVYLFRLSDVRCAIDGEASIFAEVEIDNDDALRLQSSLRPPNVKAEQFGYQEIGNSFVLHLTRPLPWPERKILSLGRFEQDEESTRRYPKRFYFHAKLRPIVEQVLSLLEIGLVKRHSSGGGHE